MRRLIGSCVAVLSDLRFDDIRGHAAGVRPAHIGVVCVKPDLTDCETGSAAWYINRNGQVTVRADSRISWTEGTRATIYSRRQQLGLLSRAASVKRSDRR